MIKSITVTNHLDDSLKLELAFPEKSGFAVLGVDGLGPSKANINSTELSTSDGSIYNSARTVSRNIVLDLKFLHSPSIEDVRIQSYKYFPVKKQVRLLIETDTRTCEIYGYVESNDPNIFSRSERTQVSIICPNPYFYSTGSDGTTITVFSGIDPLFEFPFSNESSTENLIDFGTVQNETTKTIMYDGDSEIGINIYIKITGDVEGLGIYNVNTRGAIKIDTDRLALLTGNGLGIDDEIFISTVKGDKYVMLLRNGVYTNILNCINKDAEWFQLSKGDNIFTYAATVGTNDIEFRIENRTIFEGV